MSQSATATEFDAARRAMVDSQLRTSGVNAPRLLEVFARVPREAFVDPARRASAYIDRAQPLAGERMLNPPVSTAQLLDAAAIGPRDRVLIIGVATGYALAIAAALADTVTGVECDATLADTARANVPNAVVVTGPLEGGAPLTGPYEAIVIDGAVEVVPQALIDQLAPGGRLATGIVDGGVTRLAVGRSAGRGFALAAFADGECVTLPGFARPKSFVF